MSKSEKSVQVRQGDILVEAIKKLPAKVAKSTDKIVAYGEATGHYHHITGSATMFADGDEKFAVADDEWVFAHVGGTLDQHDPITLPAGKYKFTRQREYDPIAEMRERKVAD